MTLPTAEQLLNLADRTPHGLTPDETARLRDGVAHHCARADHADAVTAATKRLMERRTTTLRQRAEKAERAADLLAGAHRQAEQAEQLATELRAEVIAEQKRAERAEAAIERVRATCARLHDLAHAAHGEPTSSYDRGIDRAAKVILAALDEPQEQT